MKFVTSKIFNLTDTTFTLNGLTTRNETWRL